MKSNKQEPNKKKITSKQMIAIVGIIILVLLYIGTFILAFLKGPIANQLFQICFFTSICLPFLIWFYIWIYGKFTQKHTMADFDIGGTNCEQDDQQL